MCLAVPAQVVSVDEASDTAVVTLGQVRKEVSLALVEAVEVGEYLLIHVGYALNKISEEEAERTLKLFEEAGLSREGSGEGSPAESAG